MGVDVLTLALSHELVEAVTDPFVNSNPAYTGIDPDHILWAIAISGAEVADLCENEQPVSLVPADIGYPVQRIWSNVGAKAGTGPCVPVPPGEIFFQAVAELSDHAPYTSPPNRTSLRPRDEERHRSHRLRARLVPRGRRRAEQRLPPRRSRSMTRRAWAWSIPRASKALPAAR